MQNKSSVLVKDSAINDRINFLDDLPSEKNIASVGSSSKSSSKRGREDGDNVSNLNPELLLPLNFKIFAFL